MRPGRSRAAHLGVALVALTALGGCASAPEEEVAFQTFREQVTAELGDSIDAWHMRRALEGQEKVTRCMQEAGFEYTPPPVYVGGGDEETPEEREEQLRTFGWGQFPDPAQVPDGPPTMDEDDPQARYEASLSPSAFAEYQEALLGPFDPETGQMTELTGCLVKGAEEEDPDAPWVQFADLLEELEQVLARANEDPEVIKARDAYRACLALAGFPGGDAWTLLEQRFEEEFPTGSVPVTDPRLPELVEWEIALANADLDCTAQARVGQVADRVRAGLQAEVLERRAEEVEAYTQAMREYYAGG